CDILTGKLTPQPSKSGKWWYLCFGPVGIEWDERPDESVDELVYLTKKTLEEFVVEDEDWEWDEEPDHQPQLENKAADRNESEPRAIEPKNGPDLAAAVREACEIFAKTGRLLDAALAYAKHGIPVFPCDPVTKVPIPRRDPDPTGKFKRGIPGTGGVK